uniref:F-box/LRR-repeat protein 15/At3g58940/PEG3-like LRR domain-containing protein n=1 Tax=Oryza punctata TaxID=4537 RepID=A0A0E0LUF7_ORYPU
MPVLGSIMLSSTMLKWLNFLSEKWEPFYLDPELAEFNSWYLKTLELTNAALNETVFGPLNNACPALENLVLKECLMEVQQISSSSLQNLDVIGCSLLKNVSICTPSLVSLHIKGQQTGSSSFTNSYLTLGTITLIDASNVTSIELIATDTQFTFVEQQEQADVQESQNIAPRWIGGSNSHPIS